MILLIVAFAASWLTFFSGFGLGTLLLPVFAVFFPLEIAVAMTAVVHFANNMFKLALVSRNIDWKVALRFGVPAILAALAGANALVWLSDIRAILTYEWLGRSHTVTPVKIVIGVLMIGFAFFETLPRFSRIAFHPRFLPLGGVLSGFFGGLSGHQGALRSAFLVRAGLDQIGFVATGVVIACFVDAARMLIYAKDLWTAGLRPHAGLLSAAIGAAFLGAILGRTLLKKMTIRSLQYIVAGLLLILGSAIGLGVI